MICVAFLCGMYLFYNTPMDKDIKNITWFSYNIKTGAYDIIKIEDSKLTYMYEGEDFDGCSSYRYNTKRKILTLDCGKEIYIKDYSDTYMTLKINNETKTFFKTTDESLNYEFKTFYEKTIIEYENDKTQVKEILKIDINKFLELYSAEERNVVVFMGDNCNNIDCTLILGILEKWNVDSTNVYFIDSTFLTQSDTNKLNNRNKIFDMSTDFYNNSYPLVVTMGNSDIYEKKPFKCNGLDCSVWKDYSKSN